MGGGTSGVIGFPEYYEQHHSNMLNRAQDHAVQLSDRSLYCPDYDDFMQSPTPMYGDPSAWGSLSTVTEVLRDMQNTGPTGVWSDFYGGYNPYNTVPYINETRLKIEILLDRMLAEDFGADEVDDLVTAYRRKQFRRTMEEDLPAFKLGMRDMGAQNGSAFILGSARLREGMNERIEDFETKAVLDQYNAHYDRILKLILVEIGQDGMWASLETFRAQVAFNRVGLDQAFRESRVKLTDGVAADHFGAENKYGIAMVEGQEKWWKWPLDLQGYHQQAMAVAQGGIPLTEPRQNVVMNMFGGMALGAGAGASLSENPKAVGWGTAIGGAAAILGTILGS